MGVFSKYERSLGGVGVSANCQNYSNSDVVVLLTMTFLGQEGEEVEN